MLSIHIVQFTSEETEQGAGETPPQTHPAPYRTDDPVNARGKMRSKALSTSSLSSLTIDWE